MNGVFDWNRMTAGIHAGFPLLNSAIRLTVYGSADGLARLDDRSKTHFYLHADDSQCLQVSGAVCQAGATGWRKRLQMHQVSGFTY